MHYNENGDRPQAETEEGVPLFSFPKARKGECRVKPQKTQQTFGKGSNQTTHILNFYKIIFLDEESNQYKNSKKRKRFVLVFYNTDYVADMMYLLFEKVFVNPTPYTDELLAIPVPEYLSAQYEKPDKEEVIASFVSRFKQGAV